MREVFLEMPCTDSHVPQVAVRSGSGGGCGSDGITRLKNKVAVKAERRWMTGSQLRTGCSCRVEAEGATVLSKPK